MLYRPSTIYPRLIVFCLTSVCTGSDLFADSNGIDPRFEALLTQYKLPKAVTFNATMTLTQEDSVSGKFQYIGAGERFIIEQSFDTKLGGALNLEAAFDGDRFQLLDKQSGTLYYAGKFQQAGAVLQNPFLYFVEFLIPDRPESLHRLRWSEVLDETFWTDRVKKAKLVDDVKVKGVGAVFDLPGGINKFGPFLYRVYFRDVPAHVPLRIDRVTAEGKKVITSTIFDEMQEVTMQGQKTYWPLTASYSGFDPSTGVKMEAFKFVVSRYEFDKPVPDDCFTIDFKKANVIWDDDARVFVQPRGGNRTTPTGGPNKP